jgi:NAD(P)-dependent dehydrogenase (short-subunit alcohol dehydrogenase family)
MTRTKDDLVGKVAVVTGGGSGLGAAMAQVLADAGMAVAVLDIDEASATSVAAALADGTGARTVGLRVDVGDGASVAAAAAAVEQQLGGCDLVCANVGVQQFGAVDRLTEDDWSWVLDVNVMGTVRTVAAFLPMLRRREGFRHVVLTSSSSALVPGVRLAAYQASKFAVLGYGETLQQELADEGIGVSVLLPAGMTTRHLESSALAKPKDKGEWVLLPDDIEALMASRGIGDDHVATPEHAVRNLLDDILANEPFIITHGSYRPAWEERTELVRKAFERMERS